MKISIIIPVYYNEENLQSLYADMEIKLLGEKEYEWEIIMVNDGSGDRSYEVMKELAEEVIMLSWLSGKTERKEKDRFFSPIYIIGWSKRQHCPICQEVALMFICWIGRL